VPGLKTSAYLTLKLYELNFEPVVMPFDKSSTLFRRRWSKPASSFMKDSSSSPRWGCTGCSILAFGGRSKPACPFRWAGMPCAALGPELGRQISKTIRDSVSYGLEHREEALNYAMQFAREMDAELADKFVACT